LIKFEAVNKDDLFCWYNYHNPSVNIDEKSFIRFNKFNVMNWIASIFHKSRSNCINFHKSKLNWNWKKLKDQF